MLVGIFVGGSATRMGGQPKGLLQTNGESLVERLVRVTRAVSPDAEIVLIGRAEAYADLGLKSLADEPAGVGPIGGLIALLSYADRSGAPSALALACDLPFVSEVLLEQLVAAPERDVVLPQSTGIWQPLVARYRTKPALAAARAALASGERALHSVIDRLDAEALSVDERELRDWDTPEDQKQDTSTGEPSSG